VLHSEDELLFEATPLKAARSVLTSDVNASEAPSNISPSAPTPIESPHSSSTASAGTADAEASGDTTTEYDEVGEDSLICGTCGVPEGRDDDVREKLAARGRGTNAEEEDVGDTLAARCRLPEALLEAALLAELVRVGSELFRRDWLAVPDGDRERDKVEDFVADFVAARLPVALEVPVGVPEGGGVATSACPCAACKPEDALIQLM